MSEQSELFQRLYCVDFVRNDGASEAVEFQPENILTFEPLTGSFGQAELSIESLRWDDVVFQHDVDHVPPEDLSRWFRLWFDLEDVRRSDAEELSGVVHSMLVKPNAISVDLGTADAEAFWDMLGLIEGAGASRISIVSSKG